MYDDIDDSFLKVFLTRLENFEGKRNFPYPDPLNPKIITIGIGYNLSKHGLPDNIIYNLSESKIREIYKRLYATFPWFIRLNEPRKIVLIDIAYNIGFDGLLGFTEMLKALKDFDFVKAGEELIKAKIHRQLPHREDSNVYLLVNGTYPT